MKKNGFTLIELLAVIVILAIIALIATPIILGIINDAREKANERSVELYASAVRNSIAAYQLREGKEVKAGTYTSETLPFDVEYDGDVECSTIELYEDGGVYVTGCEVNDVEVEYTYGTKQVAKGTIGICNPISVATEGTYTAGDKYECDVDPNKEGYDQIFYVLTTVEKGATSVNLIMDSNIKSDGTFIKETNEMGDYPIEGVVGWTSMEYLEKHASQEDIDNYINLNIYGPITAMEFLQNATLGWTNVNPQTVSTYTDDVGEIHEMDQSFTINARLPYFSEVKSTGCDINLAGTCPDWMVDYLSNLFPDKITGYWTLSSYSGYSGDAVYVSVNGSIEYNSVNNHYNFNENGVRPVINLSI